MSGRRGRLAGMNNHIEVDSGDVLVTVGTTRRKHVFWSGL
jgi:hypothetical protein